MMDTWLNKSEISDITGIPYSTLSRILSRLNQFFDAKREGKKRLFRESQIHLIETIRELLADGKTYDEIYDILAQNQENYMYNLNNEDLQTVKGEPPRMYKVLEIIANQEKEICMLKDIVSSLEKTMEIQRSELLNEINDMLLEFMKNTKR